MTPPFDKLTSSEPALSKADQDWTEGFDEFAEAYIGKYPAAFERSRERRALYGDDRDRELAELENGTHPLFAPAR